MSESQNYEEVTVASNGITVIKTFEADAFPVPAIAFRIKSDRTEAVTVRLVDDVPENVAVEDLGFHPEYGSEFWTIEDDEITFERELESEEQYTTVYGIRATGTDDVEQFLTEPTIADVDPPLEDEDGVVGGSGSDVVRDVISGNTDSVPGLEDEEDDEDIGTLDLADPNESEESAEEEDAAAEPATDEDEPEEDEADAEDEAEDTEAEAEETDEEAETADEAESTSADETTTDASASIESVASALATEIREGTVDDDDLELLRDELDLGGSTSGGAVDARIEKLQTDIADLEAYIDALEEFLDENGTGQEIIEDLQGQVDDVTDELASFEDDIDSNEELVTSIDDDVDELEGDLKSLKADIKDLDDDVEDMQDHIDTVEDEIPDVDDIGDRLTDIEDDIVDLKEWREQLSNVLGAADD